MLYPTYSSPHELFLSALPPIPSSITSKNYFSPKTFPLILSFPTTAQRRQKIQGPQIIRRRQKVPTTSKDLILSEPASGISVSRRCQSTKLLRELLKGKELRIRQLEYNLTQHNDKTTLGDIVEKSLNMDTHKPKVVEKNLNESKNVEKNSNESKNVDKNLNESGDSCSEESGCSSSESVGEDEEVITA